MSVEVQRYVPAAESETGESYSVHSSEFIGLTVEVGSTYLGDGDSSYWAVSWSQEKGEFVRSGGGWYPTGLRVDAPEPLLALYQRQQAAKREVALAEYALREYQSSVWEAEREAAAPSKGKVVEVVKGRKVAKGTVGTVVWYGEGTYGWRVGLKVPGQAETVWTSADNVEVVPAGRLGLAA